MESAQVWASRVSDACTEAEEAAEDMTQMSARGLDSLIRRAAHPQYDLYTMASLVRLRLFTVPSPARYSLRALHTSPLGHGFSPFSPLSHNFRLSFPKRPLPLILIPTRTISLGSIFSTKISPAPSPHAVAHVARIEADANTHPYDVEKQLALFQALSETNIQPGYELIINRWERMTEFVRSSFWNTPGCFIC
jgi:hypothetical protein